MKHSGHTLVEVLVVTGIIGILLAVAIPAVSRARGSSDAVLCTARLSNIMVGHASVSAMRDGRWANLLEPGSGLVEVSLGGNGTSGEVYAWTMNQVADWAGALKDALLDGDENGEPFACPTVFRRDRERYNLFPILAGRDSYYYSAAFFTAPALWDPDRPDARRRPDDFRRSVRTSEVTFPSRKVVMFECAEHHRSGANIGSDDAPTDMWVNASFADGHVRRVVVEQAAPALPVQWPVVEQMSMAVPLPTPLPFSSPAWGCRGRDL